MASLPTYTDEQIIFVVEGTMKAATRGDTNGVYDQVIRGFEDKFGAGDIGTNLVRFITEKYKRDPQFSNGWANMGKLHSNTLLTMVSSDTDFHPSEDPRLDTSESTTIESSDSSDQENISPPLSSHQQQPRAAQRPTQNAQFWTPEPSTSPTSPTSSSEGSSDTLRLDDQFSGVRSEFDMRYPVNYSHDSAQQQKKDTSLGRQASSSRFTAAHRPGPPHVGMTMPTVRRTARNMGYQTETPGYAALTCWEAGNPNRLRKRHTIHPPPPSGTPSPFPHAHPGFVPPRNTYTPMANPNIPKPSSGYTWQAGGTGRYVPDIYPINMFTGERLSPTSAGNLYKRAYAEPERPQRATKHARIDEGVENYGVWDGTKFYFTADPDRQTFQWPPRPSHHGAGQMDIRHHAAQPRPGVSTEPSTEYEVYDISDPGVDVLLEKPSTSAPASSAAAGSQNTPNKGNHAAISSRTNI